MIPVLNFSFYFAILSTIKLCVNECIVVNIIISVK